MVLLMCTYVYNGQIFYSMLLYVLHCCLRYFLSTESEQLVWKGEGLPSDDLSVENALVILQVSMFD